MQLQQLQTNLCSLIKMRNAPGADDAYLKEVSSSSNLLLIRKIALWWRQIQIENSCVLTANLLKRKGMFSEQLSLFFRDQIYSPFREEVFLQFLQYIVSKETDSIIKPVAGFELALIKARLGETIDATIYWEHNPYEVIQALLDKQSTEVLFTSNKCATHISCLYKEELFKVIPCSTKE